MPSTVLVAGTALLSALEGIRLTQENATELLDLVVQENGDLIRERNVRRLQLRAEETGIIERMDTMCEERLDKMITEEDWLRRDSQQQARLLLVREELERVQSIERFDEESIKIVLELAQRLPGLNLRKSHDERAQALKIVCQNFFLTQDNAEPVYKEPFAAMTEHRLQTALYARQDSNL